MSMEQKLSEVLALCELASPGEFYVEYGTNIMAGDGYTEAKTAGCMLAHWRFSGNAGGAQKPDDICAGFACGPCHTAMDSNGTAHGIRRGSEEWLFYAFRATVRTLRWWRDHGFLTIKGDK